MTSYLSPLPFVLGLSVVDNDTCVADFCQLWVNLHLHEQANSEGMKVNMEERRKFSSCHTHGHLLTFVRFLPENLSPCQIASVFFGGAGGHLKQRYHQRHRQVPPWSSLWLLSRFIWLHPTWLLPLTHCPGLLQICCHSSFHWKPLWPKSIMTSLSLNSMDIFLSPSYPTALQDLTWLTTLLLLKVFPPSVSMTTPPGFLPPWALLFSLSAAAPHPCLRHHHHTTYRFLITRNPSWCLFSFLIHSS